jgi:hypothetical protein
MKKKKSHQIIKKQLQSEELRQTKLKETHKEKQKKDNMLTRGHHRHQTPYAHLMQSEEAFQPENYNNIKMR